MRKVKVFDTYETIGRIFLSRPGALNHRGRKLVAAWLRNLADDIETSASEYTSTGQYRHSLFYHPGRLYLRRLKKSKR